MGALRGCDARFVREIASGSLKRRTRALRTEMTKSLPPRVSLKRAIMTNMMVQVFGPAASFLNIIVIARLGGAGDQGHYAQLRAWIDVLAAVGCFGFPQGFVFVINRLRASARVLAGWSVWYSVAFVALALAATAIGLRFGAVVGTPTVSPVVTVSTLAVASAAITLHSLWRGTYLTHDPGVRFAVFTILPPLWILAVSTATMLAGWREFEWIPVVALMPALLIEIAMMRPILRQPPRGTLREQHLGPLVGNGMHAFLQSMLATVQPFAAYWMVRLQGGGNADVGYLNAGMFLVQGMSVPVTMVAPLLLERWTSEAGDGSIQKLRTLTQRFLMVEVLSGVVLAVAAAAIVPVLFGSSYARAVLPAGIMLLTVPFGWHVRVVEPALYAKGRAAINTVAGLIRVAAFCLGSVLLSELVSDPLTAIATSWTVSVLLGGCWTLLGLRSLADRAGGMERQPQSGQSPSLNE